MKKFKNNLEMKKFKKNSGNENKLEIGMLGDAAVEASFLCHTWNDASPTCGITLGLLLLYVE